MFDQIDDAAERIFLADGILNGNGIGLKPRAHHSDTALEIRAGTVHLVDESNARNLVFIRLPPYRFRLRLHAADRAENRNRAVEHAQVNAPLQP